MRYKSGHKSEAKAKMLAAAGRGFRRRGFAGIGVDGLAKEAEVTSGAFYSHFPSKEVAFQEAVSVGLEELRAGIAHFQSRHGANWLLPFIEFYLSEKRNCELGVSCALQSLSPEVVRADAITQDIYRTGLVRIVDQIAHGLPGKSPDEKQAQAWCIVSLLTGAVTLARAVGNENVAAVIADAAKAQLLRAI